MTQAELTPVQALAGTLFKRDDLYRPYADIPLSGGKVRQCEMLLQSRLTEIQEKHHGTIATCTSVDSPQGIIVASVAHKLGLQSILGVGGRVDFSKHPMLQYCEQEYGTELKILSGIAYNSTLTAKMEEYRKTRPHYLVKFGINLESDAEAILGSIATQVQNLPADLENLVIPCGSAITMAGILIGLHRYKIKPKRIVGIQIAGIDRRKDIDKILMQHLNFIEMQRLKYEFILDKQYPYSRKVKAEVSLDFILDPIYEAKAYERAVKENLLNSNSLFWVVGDSQPVRDFTASRVRR